MTVTITPTELTRSRVATVTNADVTRVILCALAGWGSPLAGADITVARVQRIVWSAVADHGVPGVMAWRRVIDPAQWGLRWDWAAATVRRLFPDIAVVAGCDE